MLPIIYHVQGKQYINKMSHINILLLMKEGINASLDNPHCSIGFAPLHQHILILFPCTSPLHRLDMVFCDYR